MAVRMTRAQRRELTRGEVLAAARSVFLRRGFHQASLEEVAEEAGYTRGAIYSNFAGKDELFVELLEEHTTQRLKVQTAQMRAGRTAEGGLQEAAHGLAMAARQDPEWLPVLMEFWTHASRDERLRQQVAAGHERLLDGLAQALMELVERFDLEFTVPVDDVVRGTAALARGLGLEAVVKPEVVTHETFERLFVAHVLALTRARSRS